MAAIDQLLEQIRQTFLSDLVPSPARRVSELGVNQFGQPRFGDGNLIVGYSSAGIPLTMKVSGSDEDLSIFTSPFIDTVRIVETKDTATAAKLADVLEALVGTAFVLDEPNRRRIRRAARQVSTSTNGDVPAGFVRDRSTGELRPRMKPGRRKE